MKTKLTTLILVVLANTAQAEIREFHFTGTVSHGMPMAPLGSKVTGRFSYDDRTSPEFTFGDPSDQGPVSSGYLIPRRMTLEVNGHKIDSDSHRVDVVDNSGGNVEDLVSVQGSPMILDGTYFSEGVFGIFLASGPGKTHVLRNTDLPKKFSIKKFDGMNYGFVQVNGGPDGTLLNFTVDSVRAKGDRNEE